MEMYHHFRDEVIISCPIEGETIPLMSVLDFQFSGTSNSNWMSDYFPRAFELARTGRWEEAMELWWQVAPARAANTAILTGSSVGTTVINRTGLEVPGVARRIQRRSAACTRSPASRPSHEAGAPVAHRFRPSGHRPTGQRVRERPHEGVMNAGSEPESSRLTACAPRARYRGRPPRSGRPASSHPRR